MTQLFLESGQSFAGSSFGAKTPALGEVVFTTGMTGYLETLTDPSYFGQIIVFTFPLIGNYGVFDPKQLVPGVDKTYESEKIWVKGVVLTEWSEEFSHCEAFQNFAAWLADNGIPGIAGVDTRELTQILRETGCIMGNIGASAAPDFTDHLAGRYVPAVSPKEITILEPPKLEKSSSDLESRGLPKSEDTTLGGAPKGEEFPLGKKTIAFVDCGAKNGIFRNFLNRDVRVIRFPFDVNPFETEHEFDGIFFSNGPGDPETVTETIKTMEYALGQDKPIFGICLGNQMLALAAGGQTVKMKYGHRGVNQPVQDTETKHCLVTTQNHGYVVDKNSLPSDFKVWFTNLNDGSVEGIKHKDRPVFAAQFHPEACAGPQDGEYLFDEFLKAL